MYCLSVSARNLGGGGDLKTYSEKANIINSIFASLKQKPSGRLGLHIQSYRPTFTSVCGEEVHQIIDMKINIHCVLKW